MADFSFSDDASPEENIEAFLTHLDSVDAEMAALLRAHVSLLLPLPDEPQRKNRARAAFNQAIAKALGDISIPEPAPDEA